MSTVRHKNTAATITINAVILPAIFYFFGPFLVMKGWNIIAWNCDLPQFYYWEMFCICNGLHWFIKGFRK